MALDVLSAEYDVSFLRVYVFTKDRYKYEVLLIVLIIRTILHLGVVNSSPNLKAGRPPLVSCMQLIFQYIRSYHQ